MAGPEGGDWAQLPSPPWVFSGPSSAPLIKFLPGAVCPCRLLDHGVSRQVQGRLELIVWKKGPQPLSKSTHSVLSTTHFPMEPFNLFFPQGGISVSQK